MSLFKAYAEPNPHLEFYEQLVNGTYEDPADDEFDFWRRLVGLMDYLGIEPPDPLETPEERRKKAQARWRKEAERRARRAKQAH